MSALNDLLTQALALPEVDRASLAHQLLLSLDPPDVESDAEWEKAWVAEVEVRLDRLAKGEASARDWRAALADMRKAIEKGASA